LTDLLAKLAAKMVVLYVTQEDAQQLLETNKFALFLMHSGQFLLRESTAQLCYLSEGYFFAYDNALDQSLGDFHLAVDCAGIVYRLPCANFKQCLKTRPSPGQSPIHRGG
jgi:hypothetical protein